jgi:GxxExxY protein
MEVEDVPELPKREKEDALTRRVIGCALTVHRELGPGLLETAYEQCLAHELALAGIAFQLQCPLPVAYKSIRLDCGYRVDLLIEQKLIVELKSVEQLLPIHEAQLLTYLRLASLHVGLLINFNVTLLKHGLKRLIL